MVLGGPARLPARVTNGGRRPRHRENREDGYHLLKQMESLINEIQQVLQHKQNVCVL